MSMSMSISITLHHHCKHQHQHQHSNQNNPKQQQTGRAHHCESRLHPGPHRLLVSPSPKPKRPRASRYSSKGSSDPCAADWPLPCVSLIFPSYISRTIFFSSFLLYEYSRKVDWQLPCQR
ncbi:hypothetical protein GGI35DRAFT_56728 [Trichoderma velutinum]